MKKKIFSGKLLKLHTEKRRLPNGYLAYLEVIKHPGAALIVPVLGRDKVVMLKQYRPVIRSYIYELPAGILAKGERPKSCAGRELTEETGYKAKKLSHVQDIYPSPGYTDEKIHIYKAEGLKKGQVRSEADEIIRSFVLTKQEVRKLFKQGRIIDAKTICALALCDFL